MTDLGLTIVIETYLMKERMQKTLSQVYGCRPHGAIPLPCYRLLVFSCFGMSSSPASSSPVT